MTDAETDALITELLAEHHREEQEDEELLALLSGPFAAVRDQNHVEAAEVLVWDRHREPVIQSVPLHELTLRYPCSAPEDGWTMEDLGKVVRAKGMLYRQSVVAHELSDEDPTASPVCGTVVFIARATEGGRHRWVLEKAAIKETEPR